MKRKKAHIDISIDKVSFTAQIVKYESSLVNFLNVQLTLSNARSDSTKIKYFYSHNNYMYQHHFTFHDGTTVQVGKNKDTEHCRVEYNPNKCDDGLLYKIMIRLKNPSVTRIDWAIDYRNINFEKESYIIRDLGSRSEVIWKGRSKEKETHYVGSPKSDNFIRVYDKAKEQGSEMGYWWRVEAVVKDFKEDGYLFRNPFEKLAIYQYLDEPDLKMQEKAMIFYLRCNPTEWNKLSYNSRKKYENIHYNEYCTLIADQPKKIFEQEKNRLAIELQTMLAPALYNSNYMIGQITNLHYSIEILKKERGE